MIAHDPQKTPMENLFPVEGLDQYPEHMRLSLLTLRRTALRRRIISGVLGVLFYASLASLLFLTAWFVAQVTDRDLPMITSLSLINPPATPGGLPAVKPGGDLMMRVQVDRKRSCEADVTFYVYDGQSKETRIVMPHVDAKGLVGLDAPFIRPLTIPADAAPGASRIRVIRAYQCPNNFVHEHYPITDVTPDFSFEILPR